MQLAKYAKRAISRQLYYFDSLRSVCGHRIMLKSRVARCTQRRIIGV
jgi:hypothetical protein